MRSTLVAPTSSRRRRRDPRHRRAAAHRPRHRATAGGSSSTCCTWATGCSSTISATSSATTSTTAATRCRAGSPTCRRLSVRGQHGVPRCRIAATTMACASPKPGPSTARSERATAATSSSRSPVSTAGHDDLVTRGHGAVRLPTRLYLFYERGIPRRKGPGASRSMRAMRRRASAAGTTVRVAAELEPTYYINDRADVGCRCRPATIPASAVAQPGAGLGPARHLPHEPGGAGGRRDVADQQPPGAAHAPGGDRPRRDRAQSYALAPTARRSDRPPDRRLRARHDGVPGALSLRARAAVEPVHRLRARRRALRRALRRPSSGPPTVCAMRSNCATASSCWSSWPTASTSDRTPHATPRA